jgi:uncharacterized protein
MLFPPGHFCIAELHTPDPEAAAKFYGPLLGWTLVPKADDYFMFQLNGRDVVGVRAAPDIPEPTWVPYVRVADADAAAKKALAHGATLLSRVSETPGVARTGLLGDSERAVFGVWEPRGVEGTEVETGPGSLWWVELATAAKDAADARYASYFDWAVTHTHKFENGENGYTLWKVGDRSVAGAFQFEPDWGVTPAWQVYFEVENFDATAKQACDLGGEQGFWRDAPNAGRIGVIVDPADALFLIAQPLMKTS